MDDVLGVPMRGGTISQSEPATTAVVAAPVEEARASVQEPSVAHRAETSWRQGAKRAWRWGAVTSGVTVCVGRRSRGGQVARALLGEQGSGILVTERSRASHWSPVRGRPVCWAHVWRDFEAIRGRGGVSEESGDALRAQAHQLLTWWHRVCAGTLTRATFRSSRSPRRQEVERLWDAGSQGGVRPTAGTGREMLQRHEALGTFVQVEGVEPTKNTAARSIRPGVQWRQGSCGTQSAEGSRFVESMMTVVATLQQQKRNVLASRTAAHAAALRGEAAPSLLPAHKRESQAAA
jgi:transposase